jgi:hypothetical protein
MHAGNLRAAGLVTSQKTAKAPLGVYQALNHGWLGSAGAPSAFAELLAPCLVFGGVTGAAQALQVPRFARWMMIDLHQPVMACRD